jgi:MSHA biogenesis protein MshP
MSRGYQHVAAIKAPRGQRGAALFYALFLLLALAVLAGYLVTSSGVQHQTFVLAADGSRAYYAARSGVDAVAFVAVRDGTCPDIQTYELDGFQVTVECGASGHTEAGDSFSVFRLSALAERGNAADADYLSRRVSATVSDAP